MGRATKSDKPLIAIFNTTPEVIDALQYLLVAEGFNVISAYVSEFRSGKKDLVKYMKEHNPDIIVYDIPPPYTEQLNFLRIVRDMKIMEDKIFIYTTTNKRALEEEEDGKLGAIEIIGKPYDMGLFLNALKKAVASWKGT